MSGGFTLLELLVVLAVLGLISAVALPQLSTLGARVEFALNREQLERALTLLPYEAFRRHEDLVLGLAPNANPGLSPAAPELRRDQDRELVYVESPLIATPAQLPVPADWRMEAPKPIYFRANGFCSGGRLIVRVGSASFIYDLEAPQCLPVEKEK